MQERAASSKAAEGQLASPWATVIVLGNHPFEPFWPEALLIHRTLVQEMGAKSGAAEGQLVSLWTIVVVLGNFCYLFVASMVLGAVFGLFTSWLMKFFKSNSTPQVQCRLELRISMCLAGDARAEWLMYCLLRKAAQAVRSWKHRVPSSKAPVVYSCSTSCCLLVQPCLPTCAAWACQAGSAAQQCRAVTLLQEVTLLGLLGYLSYLCGDVLGLSGIVSLFTCAVAISHYALHNVNTQSRVTTVSAFQTLSYMSEGAIFIYVGMDALDPIKWRVRTPVPLGYGTTSSIRNTKLHQHTSEHLYYVSEINACGRARRPWGP